LDEASASQFCSSRKQLSRRNSAYVGNGGKFALAGRIFPIKGVEKRKVLRGVEQILVGLVALLKDAQEEFTALQPTKRLSLP
jgi:hypothetical protein